MKKIVNILLIIVLSSVLASCSSLGIRKASVEVNKAYSFNEAVSALFKSYSRGDFTIKNLDRLEGNTLTIKTIKYLKGKKIKEDDFIELVKNDEDTSINSALSVIYDEKDRTNVVSYVNENISMNPFSKTEASSNGAILTNYFYKTENSNSDTNMPSLWWTADKDMILHKGLNYLNLIAFDYSNSDFGVALNDKEKMDVEKTLKGYDEVYVIVLDIK